MLSQTPLTANWCDLPKNFARLNMPPRAYSLMDRAPASAPRDQRLRRTEAEVEPGAQPTPLIPAIATGGGKPGGTALHIPARFCIQPLAAVIETVTGTRSSAG